MVTHSPMISFSSFTACSSPLMSTESIVQKNCTLSSFAIADIIVSHCPLSTLEPCSNVINSCLRVINSISLNSINAVSLISKSPPRFTSLVHFMVYSSKLLSSPSTAKDDRHSTNPTASTDELFSQHFRSLKGKNPAAYLITFSSSFHLVSIQLFIHMLAKEWA